MKRTKLSYACAAFVLGLMTINTPAFGQSDSPQRAEDIIRGVLDDIQDHTPSKRDLFTSDDFLEFGWDPGRVDPKADLLVECLFDNIDSAHTNRSADLLLLACAHDADTRQKKQVQDQQETIKRQNEVIRTMKAKITNYKLIENYNESVRDLKQENRKLSEKIAKLRNEIKRRETRIGRLYQYHPDNVAGLRKQTIEILSKRLSEAGYYNAEATDEWGPELTETIEAYQSDHDMSVTGNPKDGVMEALGIPVM